MNKANETELNMQKKQIIDAYIRIRKIDHTIPDDVLDFMKESAINAIDRHEPTLKSSERLVDSIDKTIEAVILDNDLNHGMAKYNYKGVVNILQNLKESAVMLITETSGENGFENCNTTLDNSEVECE